MAEARKKFNLSKESNHLLVLGNKRHLYKSLRQTVNPNDWESVFFLYRNYDFTFDGIRFLADKFKRPIKNLLGHYRYRKFLIFVRAHDIINKVVASNFQSNDYFNRKFLSQIPCQELIHYDDGTASLALMSKMKFINSTGIWTLGKVTLPDSMTFFTSYALALKRKQDRIVHNEFLLLKEEIVDETKLGDFAYFIGGNIYAYYTTFEIYLDMLKRIKQFFLVKGVKSVHYIAHRNESAQNLEIINNIFPVKAHTKSFEKLLIEDPEQRPAHVASFFSSALTTTSIIFNHIPAMHFYSFKMDDSDRATKNRQLVDALYRDFELNQLNNIKVISEF